MEGDVLIKVHKTYRWVVAICDADLVGKKFEEGNRQLDVSKNFFEGDSVDFDEFNDRVGKCLDEDATFFIIGEKSIKMSKDVGLIDSAGVGEVDSVPFALVLL
jgi:uncharacterized protein